MTLAPATYTCPMHPEVETNQADSCPKCGMALEPTIPVTAPRAEWTCPMHPEIVQDAPGACPICGMALEPSAVDLMTEEDNPELEDMSRRFWLAAAFTVPLVFLAMGDLLPGAPVSAMFSGEVRAYLELALAIPVCLWSAWPETPST